MSHHVISAQEALLTLTSYDAVIDARSPAEFLLDHLPHAMNWPSLSDQEREQVGIMYKQVGAFEAKKWGAVLVARNIATHVQTHCLDKTKNWRALIYCWRGGKRSGSLALVLSQIGFNVHLIEGGYKAFRSQMLLDLSRIADEFDYRIVCAPTGCGKTRLLHALSSQGAQVLDLERLANHKSSVLGLVPGQHQPTQKQFDMRIWQALQAFDRRLPVFVESESKKVGNVTIPDSLIAAMRKSPCLGLEMSMPTRVALLMEDYDHFVQDVELFCARLEILIPLRGKALVQRWQEEARSGQLTLVVEELLRVHYDPSYLSSMSRNFAQYPYAEVYQIHTHDRSSFTALAQTLLT